MAKKLEVSVLDYIADNCGELVTYAFQKAIDYCFKNGGGEVIVPAGKYLVGDIRLRSNVTFHLLENAVLKGSRNPADYQNFFNDTLETLPEEQLTGLHWKPIPKRKGEHGNDHLNTAGSYWHYAVIRAAFSENIAIIGEAGSQIDGQHCYS